MVFRCSEDSGTEELPAGPLLLWASFLQHHHPAAALVTAWEWCKCPLHPCRLNTLAVPGSKALSAPHTERGTRPSREGGSSWAWCDGQAGLTQRTQVGGASSHLPAFLLDGPQNTCTYLDGQPPSAKTPNTRRHLLL